MPKTQKYAAEPALDALAAEAQAFRRQRPQLMKRFAGQYVALSGGRVVDHNKDDEVLADRMYKRLGDRPFYIARLEENPSVYEIPSPELAD